MNPVASNQVDGHQVDERRAVGESTLEGLLAQVGHGGRAMIEEATRALVRRFGDRGSCVLVAGRARVVLSTEVPELTDFTVDLTRYPEIAEAFASREVVAIEDVRQAAMLRPVADLLPNRLGAVVVVPLVLGTRCLGVLMAQSERARKMSPTEVAAARLEGRLLATLLDLQFGNRLDSELEVVRRTEGVPRMAVRSGTPTTLLERHPSGAIGVKRRILVGEDDPDQAATLERFLTGEGFEVALTENGAELLKQAYRAPPDLILLDGNMPILNGFDAAEKLRAETRTSHIPVLFLSGVEDLVSRIRRFKSDTIDFLRKPYSPLELLARIERSLNQGRARNELRVEAEVDALTGLGNARALGRALTLEQSRTSRYGDNSAIVMMDVDKLKTINDCHGHVVGSRVLQAIGELLLTTIRDTDRAARYGGDEFVVILSHTSVAEGAEFAGRFLGLVRELRPEGIDVSMSLGVASLGGSAELSGDALLAQADAAAYRAKHQGGNRVCIYAIELDPIRSTPVRKPACPSGHAS